VRTRIAYIRLILLRKTSSAGALCACRSNHCSNYSDNRRVAPNHSLTLGTALLVASFPVPDEAFSPEQNKTHCPE